MKYYETFLKLGCFSYDEALKIIGAERTTKSLLGKYSKRGYVASVKRGLYVAINPIDGEPVANKYIIASKLAENAFVSHHSAFEYYGYSNQVSHDVTFTSENRVVDFEFGGLHYRRMTPTIKSGVVRNVNGICVTDVERTVIDSINSFENVMGFEELIRCISSIPLLNETKMLQYLDEYDKQFLYQKVGFILEHFKNELDISDKFISVCNEKKGKSSGYLMKDIDKSNMSFSNDWHLTIPNNLWVNIFGEENENADI